WDREGLQAPGGLRTGQAAARQGEPAGLERLSRPGPVVALVVLARIERRTEEPVARLDAVGQRLAQLFVLLTQLLALPAQFAGLAQLAGDAVEDARQALGAARLGQTQFFVLPRDDQRPRRSALREHRSPPLSGGTREKNTRAGRRSV